MTLLIIPSRGTSDRHFGRNWTASSEMKLPRNESNNYLVINWDSRKTGISRSSQPHQQLTEVERMTIDSRDGLWVQLL